MLVHLPPADKGVLLLKLNKDDQEEQELQQIRHYNKFPVV